MNQKINIVYKNKGQTTIIKNVVNTDKLVGLTGYSPSTTIEDGIASIIKGTKISSCFSLSIHLSCENKIFDKK